jgi:DNA-binding protein H-NS
MPKLSLKAIQRQIAALELKAEKLKKKDRKPALRSIVMLMRTHALSVGEISTALSGGKKIKGSALRGKFTRGARRKPVPAMYRNSKTGETWSGRGRTARWLAAAEKAGRKRTEFLIKKKA